MRGMLLNLLTEPVRKPNRNNSEDAWVKSPLRIRKMWKHPRQLICLHMPVIAATNRTLEKIPNWIL